MRLALISFLKTTGAGCVIAIGALAVWEASRYPVGELTHMGPGYFPIVLGVLMMAVGLVLLVQSAGAEPSEASVRLRPALAVFGGIAAFGFLLERTGVVPAVLALVLISSLAEDRVRPVLVLVLSAALSAIAVGLFMYGLGMPLRAFRWP
jgi:hypothetical protein